MFCACTIDDFFCHININRSLKSETTWRDLGMPSTLPVKLKKAQVIIIYLKH